MTSGKLYDQAFYLSVFTILYNLAEGIVSIYFGIEEDTLTLFGFGVDSFIEALSGIGIAHMVIRIRNNELAEVHKFEKTALQMTGLSFYLLSVGLGIGIVIKLMTGEAPRTTLPGVIISAISIAVMYFLWKWKMKVGKALNSKPIIADASCTIICIYMSLVLLAFSGLYEITKIKHIDMLGTVGIIYFCIKEGKEAFDQAKGVHSCGCEHHH